MRLPEAQEALEDHCHPSGQQVPIRKNKQQNKWRPKHLSKASLKNLNAKGKGTYRRAFSALWTLRTLKKAKAKADIKI